MRRGPAPVDALLWALLAAQHVLMVLSAPFMVFTLDSVAYVDTALRRRMDPAATLAPGRTPLAQWLWDACMDAGLNEVGCLVLLHAICLAGQWATWKAVREVLPENARVARGVLVAQVLLVTVTAHAHHLMMDTLLFSLVGMLAWAGARGLARAHTGLAALCGVALGVAVCIKPVAWTLLPGTLCMLWAWENQSVRQRLLHVLVATWVPLAAHGAGVWAQYASNGLTVQSVQLGAQLLGVAMPWIRMEGGVHPALKAQFAAERAEYLDHHAGTPEGLDWAIFSPGGPCIKLRRVVQANTDLPYPLHLQLDDELSREIALEAILDSPGPYLLRVARTSWGQLAAYAPTSDFSAVGLRINHATRELSIRRHGMAAGSFLVGTAALESRVSSGSAVPGAHGLVASLNMVEGWVVPALSVSWFILGPLFIALARPRRGLFLLGLTLMGLGLVAAVGLLVYPAVRYAVPCIPPLLVCLAVGLEHVLQRRA